MGKKHFIVMYIYGHPAEIWSEMFAILNSNFWLPEDNWIVFLCSTTAKFGGKIRIHFYTSIICVVCWNIPIPTVFFDFKLHWGIL